MRVREARYTDFGNLAAACTTIGNETSDASGFVRIERLLERFGARIFLRPLLVEGMLATIDNPGVAEGGNQRWAVLIDSEKFNLTEDDVRAETSTSPLPPRFRNTVAHELVHSIAFRSAEFGISLRNKASSQSEVSALVKEIEAETEKLSPLLLCPEASLEKLASGVRAPLSIDELVGALRDFGVSREVLVNRFGMLQSSDRLLGLNGFRNLAVGIGEWQEGGASILRKWPLFANFDRGIVPEPILKIFSQAAGVPAKQAFPFANFMMCGGTERTIEVEVNAGTRAVPAARKLRVECAVEVGGWRSGEEFLFSVRALAT